MALQHIQLREKPVKETKQKTLQNALKKGPIVSPSQGWTGLPGFSDEARKIYESKQPSGISTNIPSWRSGAGSLEEALRAATPATGSAIDIQGQAWAKRKEMVEANQAKLNAEADALYGAVQDLSKEDQNFILSKIAGKSKGTLTQALAGTKGGVMYPSAAGPPTAEMEQAGQVKRIGRTDPLLQTMLDKNYIRQDETGYSWMLPEEENKVLNVSQWTDEQGWLNQTTVYANGKTDTQILGREEKEAAEPPSISDQVAVARLEFDVQKFGPDIMERAMKLAGPPPVVGVSTKTAKGFLGVGEKEIVATQKDYDNWVATAEQIAVDLVETTPNTPTVGQVPSTIEEAKLKYQNDPAGIEILRKKLGLPPGGWDTALEDALKSTGGQ